MGEPIAPLRPLRADAARNRARILDAARTAFAASGLDVGVEEIARRAGVGKGTLYRRFPTKEALVRAIFDDLLDDIETLVETVAGRPDAGEAFVFFLGESARRQATNQGFLDVVAQRLGAAALTSEQRRRFLAAMGRPLRRAQEAGSVRGDLVAEDVQMIFRMLGATTRPAADGSPMDDHWPRYIGLVCDALRPEAATPLPAGPWRSR
ncbi:TetR/AcrR family transcriptional regulator [Candidatus Solirubrobacter pratensis]|uniref:TetR/AcrR family transcriptional regulator n=1 Tax=Candidatus Solirubrobacter pratensis TaxID=1298857 RepID=UPI00055E9DFF|nr:TetR/AcrR family transcriptional regulator [Candidatus Solirubrobacter pratensis]